MTYEEFNAFCRALPATTHVVQWGGADVWKVGGKVFAIGGWSSGAQPAFIFKTSERNYFFLEQKDGYRPAPYFANRGMKWIQQHAGTPAEDEELEYYISESYRMAVSALTRKLRRELGLDDVVQTR